MNWWDSYGSPPGANYSLPPVYRGGSSEGVDPTTGLMPLQHLLLSLRGMSSERPQQQGGGLGMGVSGMGANFGGGGGGLGGFNGSPWDAAFSLIGPVHGALEGNDPSSPFVSKNRNPHGSDNALVGVGGGIGAGIGSIFGMPGAGSMAGQNIGATVSDLAHGDIHNLGYDVSANLPPLPGMQAPGWKGLLNGATGLPLGSLFGLLFK